ncbi:MAG: PQQ-binding-like beta-propeller repeat protein [archaeon]|nr:PQQ-binding-like beta-propeller repeat protein [archaeon]
MRFVRSLVVLMILSAMFLVAPLVSASDWRYTNETIPDELELLWSYEPRGWWDRLVTSVLGMIIPEIKMMISTDPLVADGKVFVIFNVKLHAIDADTGKLIWSYYVPSFGGLPFGSVIAIADDKVFVSFDKTYALDADTGEIIWSFEDSGNIKAVVDGKIFVSSRDKIYCLDENTGNLIRSYEIAGPPTIAEGKIFVQSETSVRSYLFSMQEGIIEELEEELNKSFIKEEFPEDLKREFRKNNISLTDYAWIRKEGEGKWVVMDEEMFIVEKEDGKLNVYLRSHRDKIYIYVLDEDTGDLIWSYEIGKDRYSTTSIAIADGKVFVGFMDEESRDSKIYALDADTGKLIWCYDPPFPCRLCPPIAIADGKVFVSFDKTYALDADTGEIIWSFPGNIKAVVDGKIFVGSQAQDKIYRLDADTGKIIKSYKLKGYNLGAYSIAIADEKVFVFFGAGGEKIYCFGVAKEEKDVPGFEVIFALAGLFVVAYLLRRVKNGK